MFTSIRAVIFDLDGLVIDSETSYIRAWQQAADAMGYDLSHVDFGLLNGADGKRVEQQLQNWFGGQFDLNQFREHSSALWRRQVEAEGIAVKPGFAEIIDLIKTLNWPYALATNSRQAQALYLLESAGLSGVFEHIIGRDQVENPKPAPDLFLHAARRLAAQPSQCLVLEDSATGVAAALAAGMRCCLIPSHLPANPTHQAHAVFDDLSQLATAIRYHIN